MKKIFVLIAVLMLASAVVFADIARPDRSPSRVKKPARAIDGTLNIKLDRDAKEARLIIPRSQVKQLQAQLDEITGDDNVAEVSATGGITRTRTIVSGLFLSLAVVFGGMWFMRSKASGAVTRTLLIGAAIGGIAAAATLVYANVGPPPAARSITSALFNEKVFIPYRFASGKVKIEVSDEATRVELIVPEAKPTPDTEE